MEEDFSKNSHTSDFPQQIVVDYMRGQTEHENDHIQTHGAHIFLIGEYAYKIKKDVKYTYLDMSTLNSRHSLCKREYDLNATVLPQIYVDVLPITFDDTLGLSIDGPGNTVEWTLKMHRFSQDKVLENMAIAGQLSVQQARDMGCSLARYHDQLESESVTDGYQRINEVFIEVLEELYKIDHIFDPQQLTEFMMLGKAELKIREQTLNRRAIEGYIKRCHGDLHLRNLLMTESGAVPFDALEFDERMATTDVLYDLAFLMMDLDHRSMNQHANALLNEYLLFSPLEQCDGLINLPLFLFCRAAIRAMTSAQSAVTSQKEQPCNIDSAKVYLKQANEYLTLQAPQLIAIGGFSGTGKSTVAKELAHRIGRAPGAIVLRSDSERKVLAGINPKDALPKEHYTQENSCTNYKHLFAKSHRILKAGNSVIIDAVFQEESLRTEAQNVAQRLGLPFTGIWMEAPTPLLVSRIKHRQNDSSDADESVLRMQLNKAPGLITWTRVDTIQSIQNILKFVTDEICRNEQPFEEGF